MSKKTYAATEEQMCSLLDQLTDIRCAIRDAKETANGLSLLDYAVDCAKRAEEIAKEIHAKEQTKS